MTSFKTKQGTELSLINLKGKDYMMVQQRMIWFREEHPKNPIQVEIIEHTDNHSVVKATIFQQDGRVWSCDYKREDKAHFQDHLEKACTSAIGRALALCGYGTQFAHEEFSEGERIVDSPVQPRSPSKFEPKGEDQPMANGLSPRSSTPAPEAGKSKASPLGSNPPKSSGSPVKGTQTKQTPEIRGEAPPQAQAPQNPPEKGAILAELVAMQKAHPKILSETVMRNQAEALFGKRVKVQNPTSVLSAEELDHLKEVLSHLVPKSGQQPNSMDFNLTP